MLPEKPGLQVTRTWDSFTDLMADALNGTSHIPENARRSKTERGEWCGEGAETWESFKVLARTGWRKAEEALKNMGARILPKIGLTYADAFCMSIPADGGMLDIGTYLTGDPDCYVTPVQEKRFAHGSMKIMRVTMNYGAPAGCSSDEMARRGIAALVLCNVLERSGRPVELFGVCHTDGHVGTWVEYRVKMKGAGEWYDIRSLSFSIAHPAMLRRVMFSLREQESREVMKALGVPDGGYGRSGRATLAADIAIPDLYSQNPFYSDKATIDWIRETLTKVGVELT